MKKKLGVMVREEELSLPKLEKNPFVDDIKEEVGFEKSAFSMEDFQQELKEQVKKEEKKSSKNTIHSLSIYNEDYIRFNKLVIWMAKNKDNYNYAFKNAVVEGIELLYNKHRFPLDGKKANFGKGKLFGVENKPFRSSTVTVDAEIKKKLEYYTSFRLKQDLNTIRADIFKDCMDILEEKYY